MLSGWKEPRRSRIAINATFVESMDQRILDFYVDMAETSIPVYVEKVYQTRVLPPQFMKPPNSATNRP